LLSHFWGKNSKEKVKKYCLDVLISIIENTTLFKNNNYEALFKYSKIASNKIQPLYAKAKTFANDVGRKIEKTSGQIGNAFEF